MGFFSLLFNKKKQKEFFLNWQKLITQKESDRLLLNYKQLKAATITSIKNDQRIIGDCLEIVEKTAKPDTFFMRLNLMVEKTKHLEALTEYADYAGIKTKGIEEFCENVPNAYNDFIKKFLIRYFSDTFDKAESMKTEKGKIGKYQKFYDSLQEYYNSMTKEHIDFIETKYRLHTNH